MCLSLPSHCEAQGPTLVLLGSQRAPMDREWDCAELGLSPWLEAVKKKEKGCFPSLVAAEADGRAGSSSCDLHICRAHMIQNLLTALVPHEETRTRTQDSHPPLISHFPFSLLCGQTCIFPVLHGKGPEANELAKWNCVVIARHRPAPSCCGAPGAPCQPTPGTP